MSDVQATSRSRRAVLGAALGGLTAVLARFALPESVARAAAGDELIVGRFNEGGSSTTRLAGTSMAPVLRITQRAANLDGSLSPRAIDAQATGNAIAGYFRSDSMAVYATADHGTAVRVRAPNGYGVSASSNTGIAIHTSSNLYTGLYARGGYAGVEATSQDGTGVMARVQNSQHPAVEGKGYGAGTGLYGHAPSGRGVHGVSASGTAGLFQATGGGMALAVEGPVRFMSAGVATIASATASVLVTPGVDLTDATKVLVTLQGDAGGSTVFQRVAIDPAANTFTVYLTAESLRDVPVSWFVIS
jgi:hypothetical protein